MTAAVDHAGMEVLEPSECWDLLAQTPVGRVGFVDQGVPVILPVNHVLDGRSIVFRVAYGAKLSAAVRASTVAFEVDDYDRQRRDGWSVLVLGVADVVEDDDELARLEALDLRPWADALERPHWIRIRADQVTGRRI